MEENGELLSGQLSFKQGLLSGWKQSFCSVLYGVLRVYSNKAPKKLLFTFNPDSSWISAKNGADNGLFVMNVTDPGLTKFFLFEAGDLERLTQWLDALKKAGWTSAVFSDKLRYHQRSILKNKLTENTMISNPEDVTQINNIALRRTNENNKEINGMPFDDSIISDKSYYCSRSILKQRHNIPVNENTSNNSEDITSDITESNLPLKHAEESNKESSHDTVFDDSIESSGTTRSLELNRIYKKPRKSDSMDSEGTADFDSVSLTSAAGSTSHHIRNNSYLESGYCSKESLATSVSTDPDTSRSVMPAFPEMDCQCEDDELEVKSLKGFGLSQIADLEDEDDSKVDSNGNIALEDSDLLAELGRQSSSDCRVRPRVFAGGHLKGEKTKSSMSQFLSQIRIRLSGRKSKGAKKSSKKDSCPQRQSGRLLWNDGGEWKDRWFLFQDCCLYCFKDNNTILKPSDAEFILDVKLCSLGCLKESMTHGLNIFTLTGRNGKVHNFAAWKEDEYNRWIETFQVALQKKSTGDLTKKNGFVSHNESFDVSEIINDDNDDECECGDSEEAIVPYTESEENTEVSVPASENKRIIKASLGSMDSGNDGDTSCFESSGASHPDINMFAARRRDQAERQKLTDMGSQTELMFSMDNVDFGINKPDSHRQLKRSESAPITPKHVSQGSQDSTISTKSDSEVNDITTDLAFTRFTSLRVIDEQPVTKKSEPEKPKKSAPRRPTLEKHRQSLLEEVNKLKEPSSLSRKGFDRSRSQSAAYLYKPGKDQPDIIINMSHPRNGSWDSSATYLARNGKSLTDINSNHHQDGSWDNSSYPKSGKVFSDPKLNHGREGSWDSNAMNLQKGGKSLTDINANHPRMDSWGSSTCSHPRVGSWDSSVGSENVEIYLEEEKERLNQQGQFNGQVSSNQRGLSIGSDGSEDRASSHSAEGNDLELEENLRQETLLRKRRNSLTLERDSISKRLEAIREKVAKNSKKSSESDDQSSETENTVTVLEKRMENVEQELNSISSKLNLPCPPIASSTKTKRKYSQYRGSKSSQNIFTKTKGSKTHKISSGSNSDVQISELPELPNNSSPRNPHARKRSFTTDFKLRGFGFRKRLSAGNDMSQSDRGSHSDRGSLSSMESAPDLTTLAKELKGNTTSEQDNLSKVKSDPAISESGDPTDDKNDTNLTNNFETRSEVKRDKLITNFESRQSRGEEEARKHSLQDEVDGPVNPPLRKGISQDALAKIEEFENFAAEFTSSLANKNYTESIDV